MDYSVIIPIHNEKDSIFFVYNSVNATMSKLSGAYEIIFVDDGSTDSSAKILGEILKVSTNLVAVILEGRVGQAQALQAGFDTARGDIFVTMDGDGQNDPADIPCLLDKLAGGYDVVYGWRSRRCDPLLKKAASGVANIIRRLTTGEKIHDVGCSLRVFRKKDIKGLCLWSGLHNFFSTIMAKRGYRITEVKVSHYARKSGVSKYGVLDRLKRGTLDLLRVSFVDIDTLMKHKRYYKIREILRA